MTATATDLTRLAVAQSGKPYVFGTETLPTDPNPRAFDCSELVQWCCDRLGVVPAMPDGAWVQVAHCRAHSNLVSVNSAIATQGALLFLFAGDPFSSKGRPRVSHVAISLGDGRTIEARGTAYGTGIFTAHNRGWTHAGLVPGLVYGGQVPVGGPNPGPKPPRIGGGQLAAVGALALAARSHELKRGATGIFVKILQSLLNSAGFTCGSVDGVFGPATEAAVKRFQHAARISVDGVVGPQTWSALKV